MKRRFFQRYALVTLMLVFFLVPFGLRGARMAVRDMRNDVRDWLPDRFQETHELEEFRRYFWGEAFVVISWEGCTGALDDQRFRMFVNKFFPELSPSERDALPPDLEDDVESTDQFANQELNLYTRQLMVDSPLSVRPCIGNQFGFYYTGDDHENWGGLREKWLRGDLHKWYYILPNGDIYEWTEPDTLFASCLRGVQRRLTGYKPSGKLVASPGPRDGPWYYQNPRRLEADLFKSVVTGPSVLNELVRPGGALEGDPQAAMERLQGVLFSEDGQRTCLLATLSERARHNLHLVVGRGLAGGTRGKLLVLAEESGVQPPPRPSLAPPLLGRLFRRPFEPKEPVLRMGGPPVDNVAIDEEGQVTLARLVGLSTLLGVFISWLSFRNFLVTLMLFFVGGVSAIASLSFIWWGASQLDAVLMSMPSLVYVLGLSGAVHIVNYYRDTVEQEGYPGSPEKAMAHGWKPCTLAAITTALGLVSLAYSDIVPIRKFGFFSAIGVVFTLTLLFTFLPAALSLWPPKSFARKSSGNADQFHLDIPALISKFWSRVGGLVVRRHRLVLIVSSIVLVVSAAGLPYIQTTVQLLKLFDPGSKIIEDYAWLETHLCKLVPMELLVRVDPRLMRLNELDAGDADDSDPEEKFRLNFLERLELTEQIRQSVDAQFGPGSGDITGTAMLATTFLPPLPKAGGGSRQASLRNAISKSLADYRDLLRSSDYFRLREEDQSELWRISLRLSALSDVDYGSFVNDLKQAVEPVLSAYYYRDRILREIDAHRDGGGFRGGRVLLLGAPLGPSRFADQPLSSRADQAREVEHQTRGVSGADPAADSRPRISGADQVRAFSVALIRLMVNAALNYRNWHDPAFELPDDFADRIDDYDCVVVIQDDPRYDLPALRAGAANLIDARDCVFHPHRVPTAAEKDWPISVVYTGLVPVVYKAQRTLLQSLIRSVGWAFVAISIVMALLLRSVRAGAVSMIPNVFPVVLVFGCMGWLNILVDIGTMMTASVAMGVAVDDTIHFLTWFRQGMAGGLNRKAAIELAFNRCATAMTQTTLIGGLGLAVFAFSTFTPTQRFGVLMLTLMTAALIGDLVFLPALLASRVGRVFDPKLPSGDAAPQDRESLVQSAPGMNGPMSRRNIPRPSAEVADPRGTGP